MKRLDWITPILVSLLLFLGSAEQTLGRGMHTSASVAVEIVSDSRGVLAEYDAGFSRRNIERRYVIAEDNERYRIRIRNRSNQRIGLVIAVDGRNIISGRKSYLRPNERMYILAPHESAEYEGWRTGRNRVNRFYFTDMHDSYAAAWGDYTAMGVIGVAVFENRHRDFYQHKGKDITRPLDRPRANARRQNPGTGFGETDWSPSRVVNFEPGNQPISKKFIKYEWRSTLCKRGIIKCRRLERHERRNRFWPRHDLGLGFVPFPPGRHYR